MKSYKEMKETLKTTVPNVRYFNREFYATFVADYRKAVQDIIAGVTAEEYYVATKQTDFYNKNSCAYCEFLQYFYCEDNLQKFRITYAADAWGYDCYHRYDYAEDEETMRSIALAEMDRSVAKFVEVMRVA